MSVTYRALAHTLVLALAPLTIIGCDNDNSFQTEQAMAVRSPSLEANAASTIGTFKANDPTLQRFFDNAAGYVVFPRVAAGGFIVGASRGDGVLYEGGAATHYVVVTAGSIGAQVGGQTFSQIIFFQTQSELNRFKAGNFEFAANASAVAARSGGSAAVNYVNGVAVFITGEEGLMAQATIGGQNFKVRKIG